VITSFRRVALLFAATALAASVASAAQTPAAPAQTPPAPQPGRGPVPNPDTLNNDQIQNLLDAFVMAGARDALKLNDAQYGAFYARMVRLQTIQRQHRNERRKALNELRQLLGPNGPAAAAGQEDPIVAKVKELDDLEATMAQNELKALDDIDLVLQPRQRAYFRLFLETMERQKVDLLLKVRQSGGVPAPAPGPAPATSPVPGGRSGGTRP
jgi:Spy/CpxP family protein refolding chaperone